ncbi:MAG: ATP-binding protein [Saprospiraceae bacterium]|nr:histidine kinase [Saprospiraceae bacterium]MCB9344668.1 histidine kinase [Lewinellaceae bacterium]
MLFARSFSANLSLRIATIFVLILAGAFLWVNEIGGVFLPLLFLGLAGVAAFNLLHYVNDTNRRLARLFESVRYSDFAIRFSSAKEKGPSFEDVNRQFNEVLEAFRQTRAEKEANLLFLNTMVQHLSTGLVAFNANMNVLVSNSAAFQQLGLYRLNHLNDLPKQHQPLIDFVQDLSGKSKLLYQPDSSRQLAVQGVKLNLQGRTVFLLTIQNIHTELQRREVDAWRNLARVLRHEMMNSITPIVSLVETMQVIVREELAPSPPTEDLKEALDVVATRSRGLMTFVDAYRSFTAIPTPKYETISAQKLLEQVVSLAEVEQKTVQIKVEYFIQPSDLFLTIDPSQIEMTLINLMKNGREAIVKANAERARKDWRITLRAGADSRGRPFIEVEDNGPGIPSDLLDEIFIPFFTTKQEGTGVGLSISRQIMQQHGGDLRVSSEVGRGTRFLLEF